MESGFSFVNSMNTRGSRQCQLGDARDSLVGVGLDLNLSPGAANMSFNETGIQGRFQGPPAGLNSGSQRQTRDFVEIIDDDVEIINSRMFAEAKAKSDSRRNHSGVINELLDVLNEAGGVLNTISELTNWCSKRKRSLPNGTTINVEDEMKNEVDNLENTQALPKKPARGEPVFTCPICIGPLNEATTTKCGHIFCNACIKAAIAAQHKCPTCRQKLGVRGIFKVYLPAIKE